MLNHWEKRVFGVCTCVSACLYVCFCTYMHCLHFCIYVCMSMQNYAFYTRYVCVYVCVCVRVLYAWHAFMMFVCGFRMKV